MLLRYKNQLKFHSRLKHMAVFPQLLTSGMKEQFWIFSIHFWINFFFRHPLLMCLLCSKIFCTPVYQTHQAWEALKEKFHQIWAVFWAPAAPSVIRRTNFFTPWLLTSTRSVWYHFWPNLYRKVKKRPFDNLRTRPLRLIDHQKFFNHFQLFRNFFKIF